MVNATFVKFGSSSCNLNPPLQAGDSVREDSFRMWLHTCCALTLWCTLYLAGRYISAGSPLVLEHWCHKRSSLFKTLERL